MADDFSQFPEVGAAGPATNGDEFSDFPEVPVQGKTAPFRQQAAAAAESGGRAVLETSGFASGAALGAGAGTAFGPAGALIGGVIGGAGGYYAGRRASNAVGLRPPEQMPPDVRPGAYFGQSMGGAIPVAGIPFGAAASGYRFGESMVGRFLNQMVETAKRSPLRFGATEASSAVSAATGAAMSEMVAPGRDDIRANAEMIAGIVNPTRLTMDALGYAKGVVGKAFQSFSPAARETAAAKTIEDILRVTGEDPSALARVLREQGVVESNVTAAQKTGSMALGALEQYLGKVNRQFGAEAAQQARDGLDVIRGQINLLTATGDPAALSAAAQLRQSYYRTLVAGRVELAKNEAMRAAGRISKDTPAAREKLSMAAREALEKSIDDGRAVESEMWSKVDGARPAQITNLRQTYDEIVADTLPELRGKKMPAVVRNFIERVSSPREAEFSYDPATMSVNPADTSPPGTSVDEMRKLRTELLAMSRAAARDPDQVGMERIYSQLAEATLDDIDGAFKGTADAAYDEARTFTREFHDVFTRSFAGRVVAEGKYGDRVAPEILLRKALATGKEAGAMQLQELEEATRFLPSRGFSDDSAYQTMMDAQERIFRIAASDSLDPMTGAASPERIAKFVRDNATLLNRFPEVRADLLAASKSEQRLRAVADRAKNVENLMSRQADFGRLMGGAGTASDAANVAVKAANRAIGSVDQEAEILRLVNVAKGGGAGRGGRTPTQVNEAVDGLRNSLFQAVLDRSTRGGQLDIELAKGFLFTPSSVGKKAPIQVMVEQGVVDQKQVDNIRKLFDAAENITRSQRPGTAVDVKSDLTDFAVSAISRMVGSGAAGAAARAAGSSTPSLVVHGAGARLAEMAMTKVPVTSTNKVLVEAMNDPERMALLLTKAKTPEQAAFQARQIHAWLVQSGIINTAGTIERQFEQPAQPPEMFSVPR